MALIVSRFMKPNTYHYVLTLSNSITYGRHFYSASTIRQSVWGAVHCLIVGELVTNTDHPEVTALFRRMLIHAFDAYTNLVYEDASPAGNSFWKHVL